ncbi:hypothetical protein [Pigmentiphaga litoralis]|uniref:hypothetical protein n=1 Tax=Pigmentiphaga litoralis TaxID=516702 RepID=UPI003B431174
MTALPTIFSLDQRLDVGRRNDALHTKSVQQIGHGRGQVRQRQVAVDDLLGRARELDLRDAFNGHLAPDAALGLVFLVVVQYFLSVLGHVASD